MDPLLIGAIGILILLIVLAAGWHIAFAMAALGILGLFLTTNMNITLSSLDILPLSTVASYTLVVIPLFVLMGNLAFIAGITKSLFDVGFKWFGRLPGGLAVATTFASAGFAAVTGSSVAMVGAMAKIALPDMDRYLYNRDLSMGTIAGSGTLGILIPPSIIAVMYAIMTDVSVGKILIAGFVPGILLALGFMVMIVIRCVINPSLGPRAQGVSWKESFIALKGLWGMMVLFGVVMGAIYLGIATPTESAAVGCTGALIMAALSKNLTWAKFKESIQDTIEISAMIFLILIGATIFTLFLARVGFAAHFIALVTNMNLSPVLMVIGFLLLYLPLGMFFEPYSMLALTLPITFPILKAYGVDGVWYGIMVIIMVEISLMTPPVGLNVFVLKAAVPDSNMGQIFKSIIWFCIVALLLIVLIFLFPDLVLFVPNMMKH